MSRLILCAVTLIALTCASAPAAYVDNVSHKIDRGFSNVLGCWLELPYHTWATAREKGISAAPIGFGKGLIMMPLRILSGAADIATFPAPCPMTGWEGFMKPEYNPWVEEPEKPVKVQPVVPPPAVAQPATEGQPGEPK